jgi:hypothetical protein
MTVLKKEQKTANELADMIFRRMRASASFVKVFKDPNVGWDATVMTEPAKASKAQAEVEKIVQELRADYDLND